MSAWSAPTVARLTALVTTAALFHRLCSVYTSTGRFRRGHAQGDETSEGGGVGQVRVQHVETAPHEQATQCHRPAQVHAGRSAQAVHGDPGGLHGRDQGVLGGEDVGHLVVEALPVPGRHHVDEQPLGTAEAEAFDEQEDPGTRRGPAGGAGGAGDGRFPW